MNGDRTAQNPTEDILQRLREAPAATQATELGATFPALAGPWLDLAVRSATQNPASGYLRLLAASDGLHVLDSSGTDTGPLGTGGGGGGTPGGSDKQVQFNDGGSFGGDSGLAYDKTLALLTLGKAGLACALRIFNTTLGYVQLQASVSASAESLTLPAATDTLIGKATTDTLTNKTFDTAGAGNVLKINGTAVSDKTGAGKVVLDTSAALTTPDIGAATGTSLAATGAITSSGGGIGYATGAGGTTTQGISGKNAAVTLNKLCGTIAMNGANLAANTTVSFVFTNSFIASGDCVLVKHDAVGALGSYNVVAAGEGAGSCTVYVRNVTSGALAEAIVLKFFVFKATTS
jgi:hypothetical protein